MGLGSGCQGIDVPANRKIISGFTLVEILIVLAIVGMLSSLLLGALTMARSRARKCVCISNLRQIGMALHMYADDWGGWILPDGRSHFIRHTANPLDESLEGRLTGLGKLYPSYLGDIEVLFCPVFRDRSEQLTGWHQNAPWVASSYVYRGNHELASGLLFKNHDKVLVMQFMREDRSSGDYEGHDMKSIPILWGNGAAEFLPTEMEHVNFNPVTAIEPFLWADQQRE